ncbi:hypothetical protein ACQ9BO_24135 [Flavobacterium sp. P21]|uniref:hypothetical protein n=1 Tax=Flavobacterium sp. P21 TaxID=3423948 RepID=UPI003D673C43
MIGAGNGPGLSPVVWGQVGGVENTTLTINNMPQHNHQLVPGVARWPGKFSH